MDIPISLIIMKITLSSYIKQIIWNKRLYTEEKIFDSCKKKFEERYSDDIIKAEIQKAILFSKIRALYFSFSEKR
jgi:hypothetical protein